VCHVLQDPAFFHFLTRIDEEFAAVTRSASPADGATAARHLRRCGLPAVVYLAVVLMLSSPPGSSSGQALCDLLSIPARTLKRWRTWWRKDFPSTPFWQSARERFMPPMTITRLPLSLLERFDVGETTDRLAQALRFIAPLSTRAMAK
jgi:hypothetical protein